MGDFFVAPVEILNAEEQQMYNGKEQKFAVVYVVGDRVEVTGLEDAVCFVGKEMPFFERLRTRGFVTDMASGAKHK